MRKPATEHKIIMEDLKLCFILTLFDGTFKLSTRITLLI